jgi:hypothetical protein
VQARIGAVWMVGIYIKWAERELIDSELDRYRAHRLVVADVVVPLFMDPVI